MKSRNGPVVSGQLREIISLAKLSYEPAVRRRLLSPSGKAIFASSEGAFELWINDCSPQKTILLRWHPRERKNGVRTLALTNGSLTVEGPVAWLDRRSAQMLIRQLQMMVPLPPVGRTYAIFGCDKTTLLGVTVIEPLHPLSVRHSDSRRGLGLIDNVVVYAPASDLPEYFHTPVVTDRLERLWWMIDNGYAVLTVPVIPGRKRHTC